MWSREQIVEAILESGAFNAERKYVERGGYTVSREPRLFKELHDGNLVRVVFPTDCTDVTEGAVVCITTLFDKSKGENIYGHIICAGPGVNTLLKAKDNPMPPAPPQEPPLGEREVRRFVAWKEASWVKFLNDDLDIGSEAASAIWLASFWKALDRMFGYGYLVNYDPDAEIASVMGRVG
jgi:hypothetical protein